MLACEACFELTSTTTTTTPVMVAIFRDGGQFGVVPALLLEALQAGCNIFFVMDERKLAEKGLFSWTLVFFEWDAFLFFCVSFVIFLEEKKLV